MKKKLTLLTILLILVMVGCGTTTSTYEDGEKNFWDKFVVIEDYNNMDSGTLCIVYDKDTKVEYYIVYAYHRFGISPIYNADGTIKVYEEGE